MNRRKYLVTVLIVFAFAAACAHAQRSVPLITMHKLADVSGIANRATDEETLRQLNEKLLTAHDKADVKTLTEIEADDFTLAGDFGVVTRQQHLDHVRNATPVTETVNRQITPQEIRIYGDVALITETDHASGSGGKSEYQTTSVWVRSGDHWKIVHMHYSRLADK